MDVLVILFTILNMTTSFFLYRKLVTNKLSHVEYVFVQPVPEPVAQEPVVAETLVENPAVPVPDERYQGWRNVKEEPVIAPPPTVHQPSAPASGPLERPYGFSA